MLFYSFFKSLVGKDVVVELKNDLSICGTLHSVDQYLNIKLTDISVTDPDKYPHMVGETVNKFVLCCLSKTASFEDQSCDMFSYLEMKWTLSCYKMRREKKQQFKPDSEPKAS